MAEPTLLVDSDVLIDFFRASPQAADWLSANREEVIGPSGFSTSKPATRSGRSNGSPRTG
jgi:hypothetical protein